MLETASRFALAGVLALAVVAKLREPGSSAEGMRAFGFDSQAAAWTALCAVIAIEAGLAIGVATGSEPAAYLAAGLMAIFAATLGSALMRGKAGESCACFGPRSTIGGWAIARTLLLALAFAALPSLP